MHYVPCLCIIPSDGTFVERGGGRWRSNILHQTGTAPNDKTDNSFTKSVESSSSFCRTQYLIISGTLQFNTFFVLSKFCSSVTERHVDISSVTMKMEVAGCLETSVLPRHKTQHKHLEDRHLK